MPTTTRHPPPGPLNRAPTSRPAAPGPGRRHLATPYLAYLAAGLVLGTAWALNEGTPPWEHAAKLLVLLFVAARCGTSPADAVRPDARITGPRTARRRPTGPTCRSSGWPSPRSPCSPSRSAPAGCWTARSTTPTSPSRPA
ncbi:hypothetical protein [Streptomyces endophytica]|uniref:Uncharacterized protein n=1 Tax=Streptomyces endophytica TaxID=2991496 RepID=A0ABY6PFT7_9ACTN|nr:hypothetical protein [Streptomyces endophytica]UZJ32738.1 hypothetical protein OJ254_23730 [Streptomyces endophytica]